MFANTNTKYLANLSQKIKTVQSIWTELVRLTLIECLYFLYKSANSLLSTTNGFFFFCELSMKY